MLMKCVVFVGGIALGYWINEEKWKLIRAFERAARAHLQLIPHDQDIVIDDLERIKFTILQHRCGVALLAAGHVDLGLMQLAMAVVVCDNPAFLMRHYQQQLSADFYHKLYAHVRVLEKELEFKRQPSRWGGAAVPTATVGTQCARSQSGEPTTSPGGTVAAEASPATSRSRLDLQGNAALPVKRDCSAHYASSDLTVVGSGPSSESSNCAPKSCYSEYPDDRTTNATKCSWTGGDEASSLKSERTNASSFMADPGDFFPSSFCSGTAENTSTFVTRCCTYDGRAHGFTADVAFPTSGLANSEDLFSSSSFSGLVCESNTLVTPISRYYYYFSRLDVIRTISSYTHTDGAQTINVAMRQYCLDIFNALRRALLLYSNDTT